MLWQLDTESSILRVEIGLYIPHRGLKATQVRLGNRIYRLTPTA